MKPLFADPLLSNAEPIEMVVIENEPDLLVGMPSNIYWMLFD